MLMSQATAFALQPETVREHRSSHDTAAVVRHLAHELRQPLSAIESIAYYLEIILPHQDPKLRQHLEKLQQLVHQTNWILSDAIHYLQACPPRPQLLDLDEIVSDCVAEWARGEPVTVHLELSDRPAMVRLDLEQARHLLHNVLSFFRQIAQPNPCIIVRSSVSSEEVILSVAASGVSECPEELSAVLEPFSPHLPAGSGLAIASARHIIEMHRGRIELHCDPSRDFRLLIAFPLAR
jgi:two-component system cell cycle sensor histidine kinase/response regulator CckA